MAEFPKIVPFDPWDQAAVSEFMRPLIEPWFEKQAWIHILNPADRKRDDSRFDEGIITVTWEPVWSGWARVKPLRTALNSKRAVNDTTTRVVQFWVDFPKDETVGDIKPGFEIAVHDGLNDPQLTNYQYYVTGAINGSDAWQRTIETVVDLESRPNYDFSLWPDPPERD